MTKQQIMDLIAICSSFPETPRHEIWREDLLDGIDDMFDKDLQLVVVEGEEGIGKTTLLSQFARRRPNHALSLFITPTSRWGYDPDSLRLDLCAQLEWAVRREILKISQGVDDSVLRIQLNKLQRLAHAQREMFYFIIDGLDDVPSTGIKEVILNMMPWGLSNFRFLLSGNYDKFSQNVSQKIRIRPFPLSRFRPEETKKYFSDISPSVGSQFLEEIHHACRGIPGRLVDVRRNLEAGTPAQVVLDNVSDLLELEWKRVNPKDECQIKILGVIAFSRKDHSAEDLARILKMDITDVKAIIEDLSFVEVGQQSEVNFPTASFRKFAVDKLRQIGSLKNDIINLLIDDLLNDPDKEEAYRDLPIYLEQVGRYNDILEYLSPEYCTKVLEISQSLDLVNKHLDLGMGTAQKLNQTREFMRFGIQKSIIAELDGIEAWQSEIEARLALGDYEAATALAHSATLKQDRLHLLAIIAKERYEQGLLLDQHLMEQIQQLYTQVDCATLGSRAIEIASDLIYSNQDLAIRMVEQATKADIDDRLPAWAFAELSVAAFDAVREENHTEDIIESLRARITDPEAQRFSAAVSLMLGNYSADRVIMEVKKLEDPSDQLFLLRRWTIENREREDAVQVVDFAYDLAIGVTKNNYVPTRDLRAIATPLPFIRDEVKARELVSKFHSQLGITERYGPTEDHIRIQLILAETECKYDFEAARDRLEEIYYFM